MKSKIQSKEEIQISRTDMLYKVYVVLMHQTKDINDPRWSKCSTTQ